LLSGVIAISVDHNEERDSQQLLPATGSEAALEGALSPICAV